MERAEIGVNITEKNEIKADEVIRLLTALTNIKSEKIKRGWAYCDYMDTYIDSLINEKIKLQNYLTGVEYGIEI